ncbi:CYTH domain-containing protein [Trinickia violacea]|uniref:CYTH domain-containing protein n=1 Tax=Trinickia violacea TaxID=2571746 RepID=A0A4P8IVI9_9BURK|nr:CYTH domain-containing protein [Trinickia violacea]QCP51134.1 CYTH domain-containing protein [Trinickia violacea]
MSIESEIKLALPPDQVAAATEFFVTRTGKAGIHVQLTNDYFDTPALTLAKSKSALRLRKSPHGWLQTYKTVGSAEGGLHRRHEWEMPVAGERLDIDALVTACDDAASAEALREAAPALIKLFSTDFTRTLWHVVHGDTEIEAAIDQGEITAEVDGVTRRTPISEIELELKHGDEPALHALQAELAAKVPGLAPDNGSKAQRGYQLRER